MILADKDPGGRAPTIIGRIEWFFIGVGVGMVLAGFAIDFIKAVP